MNRRPLRTAVALALALAGMAAAQEPAPFVFAKEIEITADPPGKDVQIFTFRITPGTTRAYDALAFECRYRQEYLQKRSDGQEVRRVVEPAAYTYREKGVRMVQDLDKYVSFRVPVALEEIHRAYGNMFATNAPVSISRIRLSAIVGDQPVWTKEFPPAGLHRAP